MSKIQAERVLLPSVVEPLHYNLTLIPNPANDFVFPGHVEINLNLKSDSLKEITLHSKELTLSKATFISESNRKTVESKKITYDEKATTVSLDFGAALPDGPGVLSIDYTGLHNNQMAGFYRSGYTDKEGNKKTMVSTQFESLDARRCFPCVDEPARKAEFTCTLVVDEGLTALSNMPIERTVKTANNKVELHFQKTPKMSTYLLAFVVGEFDYIERKTKNGVQLRVYTPPGKQALGEFALDAGAKCLDLYDDMFGVPFPLPKMDMIGIPEFAAGAMENWGLVTYREVDLLIDAKRASPQQKQRVAIVVCHELAHQWFGNLVTMAWWDDLWLNEGFASWMENYATDKIFPEYGIWEQFVIETQAGALGLDSLATSHPIQVPIKHAEEVEEVFDAISYYKGACVVRLIHAYLGHDNFLKGLQLYMERHKYGNTETYNLWNAWEEASKLPVNQVMSSWTEQMGLPLLTVTKCAARDKTKVEITVEQSWFLADGSTKESPKVWSVPLFVATAKGTEQLELFDEKRKTYVVDLGKGDWFKLNADQHVPVRVNYAVEQWEKLKAAVEQGKLTSTNDKSGLLMDAYALMKAGKMDPALVIELLSGYSRETSYPVWEAIQTVLHGVHSVLQQDKELLTQFELFANSVVVDPAAKLGWESKATDGHLDKLSRSLMINALTKFAGDNKDIIAEARKRFDAYVSEPNSEEMAKILPTDYRGSVLRLVLKTSDAPEEDYKKLKSTLEVIENASEKVTVLRALGFVKDAALKRETLEWALSGEVKLQDFFYPMASVRDSSPEALQLTWDFYQENFDKLKEMIKGANPSIMESVIYCCASGFATEEKAEEIEAFFKAHETRGVERGVAQLVEATRNKAKFRDIVLQSDKFISFLKTHR